MGIAPRQIGWSNESNLLWNISKQLDRLTAVMANISPGGGGTNPTSTFVPFNNAGTFADSFLVNDTTASVLKTVYSASDIGLKLDFANGQYWLGNSFFNGLGMSPNTGYYYLGDSQGNVPGLLSITILPNQLFIQDVAAGFANFIVNNAGTSASEVNLTIQNDSTLGDFIKTRYNNNDIGLKLDFAGNLFELGQPGGFNRVYVDNLNGEATLTSSDGVDGTRVSAFAGIGEIYGIKNNTFIRIEDVSQRLELSGNLSANTAGASSGQFLKIRIGGVDYKIALLNN